MPVLDGWRALSLSRQFLIASSFAILLAMIVVSAWLSSRIESAVSQNSAVDAALYVEAVIGERIQGLADKPEFDPAVQRDLEQLVLKTPLGRRIVSFKVWIKGGRIIYASTPEHVGSTFPTTSNLREAWQGRVKFDMDALHEAENEVERGLNLPLLEIYVPVRRRYGGDVIAVLEFYEDATGLVADVNQAKLQSWLLLSIIGSAVVGALYGMARRASQTIDRQQAALNDRISDLSSLLAQNLSLRERVEAASRRAAVLNERYMRRIGSDLHDGPAQLISLALLRLDSLRVGNAAAPVPGRPPQDAEAEKTRIRQALESALKDIRVMSLGLSVPELDNFTLSQTIAESVRAHEHRTQSRVELVLERLPAQVADREAKIAIYRLVQEGLNNANKHAPGARVRVLAGSAADGRILVEITDDGPGFDVMAGGNGDRLGLIGMRERLETIGGSLAIISTPGHGTRLSARLPVGDEACISSGELHAQ
ncbi:MAG: sensor histidine kinase [Hyphomicrobiaceae bacterium]|nr:sensor histidine kinase [Hyphomicrobiaceae bacterium]